MFQNTLRTEFQGTIFNRGGGVGWLVKILVYLNLFLFHPHAPVSAAPGIRHGLGIGDLLPHYVGTF